MAEQKQGRTLGRPKSKGKTLPTRDVILQAATRLFFENGFQKVSVDDIASEAGMTKATVYYYFDTKAELFKETIVSLMGRIRERIIQILSTDKPLYERLFDVTIAHLQATTSFDLDGFMRESRSSLSDEQIQAMKIAEEKMYSSIEDAFIAAGGAKEIPNINAKFAAHSYIALVKVGNYKQSDGTSFFATVEETATNILNVFWKGFFGK
ncbi:TetR/AcrR family transcriptional regulator [Bacillus sp. APMAM]|uniref:TetR/AcrR family transcriptional regulator n=1 Tax=Margalitia sp. FSL K6-0131 TaxID=2954604 RepID=UPI000F891E7C|nr:TetR/AcrR family transcriptional regulator [Bacillus sp. APMAM]RTZ57327.1 TetR/AcrR family transcriptional regulator [Bacillus sp. SAJ1]